MLLPAYPPPEPLSLCHFLFDKTHDKGDSPHVHLSIKTEQPAIDDAKLYTNMLTKPMETQRESEMDREIPKNMCIDLPHKTRVDGITSALEHFDCNVEHQETIRCSLDSYS